MKGKRPGCLLFPPKADLRRASAPWSRSKPDPAELGGIGQKGKRETLGAPTTLIFRDWYCGRMRARLRFSFWARACLFGECMPGGSSFSSRSAISRNRPPRFQLVRLVLMVGLIPFCSQRLMTAIANQSYQTCPLGPLLLTSALTFFSRPSDARDRVRTCALNSAK